jgi:hypothetical protein
MKAMFQTTNQPKELPCPENKIAAVFTLNLFGVDGRSQKNSWFAHGIFDSWSAVQWHKSPLFLGNRNNKNNDDNIDRNIMTI